MLLLSIVTLVFFVVIGMLIYSKWPAMSSGQSCGGCGRCNQCRRNMPRPCGRCGQPANSCPCQQKQGGCPFC